MATNDRDQKIRQLKEKLEMCKEFIKNEPKEAQNELAECQQDYLLYHTFESFGCFPIAFTSFLCVPLTFHGPV